MHGYACTVPASVAMIYLAMIYLAMIIVMIANLHVLTVYKLQYL